MLHKLHTDRKVLMNLVSYILCGLTATQQCQIYSVEIVCDSKIRHHEMTNSAFMWADMRYETRLIFATLVTFDPRQAVFCPDIL